jgi:hypothetical protein
MKPDGEKIGSGENLPLWSREASEENQTSKVLKIENDYRR